MSAIVEERVVRTIPIEPDDIPAGRALRAEFARFWSTQQGEPRTVYDRFIAATPIVADVTVQRVAADPGPGVWLRPADAAPDRVLLFLHGGGYDWAARRPTRVWSVSSRRVRGWRHSHWTIRWRRSRSCPMR